MNRNDIYGITVRFKYLGRVSPVEERQKKLSGGAKERFTVGNTGGKWKDLGGLGLRPPMSICAHFLDSKWTFKLTNGRSIESGHLPCKARFGRRCFVHFQKLSRCQMGATFVVQ